MKKTTMTLLMCIPMLMPNYANSKVINHSKGDVAIEMAHPKDCGCAQHIKACDCGADKASCDCKKALHDSEHKMDNMHKDIDVNMDNMKTDTDHKIDDMKTDTEHKIEEVKAKADHMPKM